MAGAFSGWSKEQRNAVIAAFLAWTLDAFDFFLTVFILRDIAMEFHASITEVAFTATFTMAMRPLGALIFGWAADRYGRKPILIGVILAYSALEFASGFASSLAMLIALRALFGVAMGGEWGVGASLAMETIPVKARGFVSGILQTGYPAGYLLASIAYGLLYADIGWRGMFMLGALPALLTLFIVRYVKESPGWQPRRAGRPKPLAFMRAHWRVALYGIVVMTALNFFGHGTGDLYPTFLQVQHGFTPGTVSTIAIIYTIGGICGGLVFGTLSQRFGRRRMMAVAALLALPVIPLWAYGTTPVMLTIGAFLMQLLMQGAWGVVPAHLNELSPAQSRGTFPGFVFALGNLFASFNATMQASIAEGRGGDYSFALASVVGTVLIVIIALSFVGFERRDATL